MYIIELRKTHTEKYAKSKINIWNNKKKQNKIVLGSSLFVAFNQHGVSEDLDKFARN